jgi:plasmid maintenance system antidote protein VapI
VTADLPDRLRRLAAAMQVPRALTVAGLRDRFGDLDQVEPAAGQVWRAEWEDVSRLVLLLAAEERQWRVVPVSVEPTGEDDDSLVVDAGRTVFPVEVTAWAGLSALIPTGTLSRVIDDWGPEITAWCTDTAVGTLHEPPADTRRGRPATDPYGGSVTVRASVADDLDILVAAPLVPVQTSAVVDLKAATVRVGLTAVIDALGLPQPTVMKIVQGKHPVTEQQAQVLAGLFGYAVEDIMAAASGLPLDLATELEQPRWRKTWRSLSRRLGVSEYAARLRAGYGTFATAFRQTGRTEPDWRSRISQWLAAHEDEIGGAEHDK